MKKRKTHSIILIERDNHTYFIADLYIDTPPEPEKGGDIPGGGAAA